MEIGTRTLERAFQLAQSGKCSTIGDIPKALTDEGYSPTELTGPSLLNQLRQLMRSAKTDTRGSR
jgi:hypothetical protein